MKNTSFRYLAISLLVLSIACQKENDTPEETVIAALANSEVAFEAVSGEESTQTKTILNENGSLSWLPGDEINIFCRNDISGRFISNNEEIADRTTFTGHFNKDVPVGAEYWAVYPYMSSNSFDGTGITLSVPATQVSIPGTFGPGMFPSVAKSTTTKLSFYNVCGLIKFSLSRNDIDIITLNSNGGESIAGTARVTFGADGKPIAEPMEGSNVITLRPASGDCFEKGKFYYISVLPGTLSNGFTLSFHTINEEDGILESNSSIIIKRSVSSKKDNIDNLVGEWKKPEPGPQFTENGLYLGITGFNQELYYYPITRLNEVSITGFYNFVVGLQMKYGTLLCYGVDQSISRLKEASFPDDLCAVALVTFTDGLDQGSVMMNPAYSSDDDYLNAINRRIRNEKISGHTIKAYSVGLRGSDVSDVDKFRSNLLKLSSGSDYAFEVSSMSEVNTKLQDIAKNVTDIIYVYDLALTIPGQSNGTRIRFTFDGVSDAGNSELYIEGTFRLSDYSLQNVTYHGLSSVSGSTIKGTAHGIFITFPFKTVKRNAGGTLSQGSIRQWSYVSSSGKWQINSEFDASQNADVEVTKQSVAVMLVLDCSSSLGSQYYTMQSHAKSFIQSLQEASYNPYAVSSVSLNYSSKVVYLGEEFSLTATVTPSTAKDKTVYWTSSDSSVADVDQSGKVTTKSVGKAVITAKTVDGGYTALCEVEVKPILVSSIKFDKTSLTLNEGVTDLISATISPDNATNKSLTWTSSDNSVATVDASGKIKALSKGTTTIKATANDDSGKYATCSVTVKRPVSSITIEPSSLIIHKGESKTLTASVYPETATNISYTWSSSNTSVATVSTSGVVKGVAKGTAIITATAKDGSGASGTCEVEVQQYVTGVTLNKTSITLNEGQSESLTASLSPDNANDKNIVWSSTNESVATVDNDGIVLAVSKGTAKITATTADGSGKSASCSVTVNRLVSSITIEPASLIIHIGESKTIQATVYPETANNTSYTWSSSNTSVATVSTSGVVKGVAKGSAIITATAKDGSGAFGTCEVDVQQYVTSITLDKTSMILNEGESSTISVSSVQPDDANDKSVVWSSTNESVAMVDQKGTITGISKGMATIKATANDGSGKTASCSVAVNRLVSSITIEPSSLIIHTGESKTLTATVYPETATNTSYTWSSSNTSVATVSTSGVVKGVAKGTVIITATAKDGSGASGTCEVDVQQYVTSITLDKTTLLLIEGESSTISVSSVQPDNANDKSVVWSSINESVATVDNDGNVTAVSPGSTKITVKANDGSNVSAECIVRINGIINGRYYVNLGLPSGLKWATFNIGASNPEEYGDYFAWGETKPKSEYSWSTYKWCNGSENKLTKYCRFSSNWDSSDPMDNKTVLDPEDDAAHVNWGDSWRMPTVDECRELWDNCTWTWTSQNGVNGRLVTGPNGNSIFLPSASSKPLDGFLGLRGHYWSSSICTDLLHDDSAFDVYFYFSYAYKAGIGSYDRYYGLPVRPVTE